MFKALQPVLKANFSLGAFADCVFDISFERKKPVIDEQTIASRLNSLLINEEFSVISKASTSNISNIRSRIRICLSIIFDISDEE